VNTIEVEDCASVSARFVGGGLGAMAVTLGSTPEISRLRFCFEHLTAESGLSPYAPGNDPWTFTPADDAAGRRIADALRSFEELPERFAGQFLAFHRTLEAGAPPPVTWDDARASIELLTALYHSAATGSDVALPVGSDHPRYAGFHEISA
jgi:predicted dehydrogenase